MSKGKFVHSVVLNNFPKNFNSHGINVSASTIQRCLNINAQKSTTKKLFKRLLKKEKQTQNRVLWSNKTNIEILCHRSKKIFFSQRTQ